MLTEAAIRKIIWMLVLRDDGHHHSGGSAHNDGLVRGLLWAMTNDDPDRHITSNFERICELAGIPFRSMGPHFHYAYDPDGKFDDPVAAEAELAAECNLCREDKSRMETQRVAALENRYRGRWRRRSDGQPTTAFGVDRGMVVYLPLNETPSMGALEAFEQEFERLGDGVRVVDR